MPDIEKITKGLMCCQYGSKSRCDGCPYDYDEYGQVNECTADLAADTLAYIRDQENDPEELRYINLFLGWLNELMLNTDDEPMATSEIIRRIDEGGLLAYIHDVEERRRKLTEKGN